VKVDISDVAIGSYADPTEIGSVMESLLRGLMSKHVSLKLNGSHQCCISITSIVAFHDIISNA